LTAEYSKEAGGESPWLLGAGSDIPLDFGARRDSRLTQADLAALQARYDYGETLWAVRAELARARAQYFRAIQAVPLARADVAQRQVRFDRLNRRVTEGEDNRPTAMLAQGELFAAEHRLSEAQAAMALARTAMAKALGVAPSAVDAVVLIDAPPATDLSMLKTWRDQAALQRRDVLRAVADYDLAEAALRLEVARQYPGVSIGPGYTWERGVNKLPFNLGLVLPPYDLNRAGIAQAEAARTQAARALETTQANVLAGVDQAAAALTAARSAQALAVNRDLPLARRTATVTASGVKAGELDSIDALGAQAAATEAQLAAIDAARAADLAAIDLEDALRRPFDPAELAALKTAAGDAS
jgi:CRISPR system Cascade subunit CasA